MLFEDICFEVYDKDDIVAKVEITENRKKVKIEKFTEHPAVQPFCGDKLDFERVCEFVSYRCFEYGRGDREELLKDLGLSEYNPWEIIKITHGRLFEDFIWIKFPGEDISWKDISFEELYRKNSEE